jgi:hypothetical protein
MAARRDESAAHATERRKRLAGAPVAPARRFVTKRSPRGLGQVKPV